MGLSNETRHQPLTLEFFRGVAKGTVVWLHYHHYNTGEFEWRHHRVQGDRVIGQFRYEGDKWSAVGDYMYEFGGNVCRGSGAEPVFLGRLPAEGRPKSKKGAGACKAAEIEVKVRVQLCEGFSGKSMLHEVTQAIIDGGTHPAISSVELVEFGVHGKPAGEGVRGR
jgi:hypothetical protein